jgi:hypothetical protein
MGATIPSTVDIIRFTISGAGMADVVQEVPVTGPTMTVTLQVPSGPGRTILVEALDAGGASHFRGTAVVDASGVALAVTIDMAVDPSNPALTTWSVVANTVSTSATLFRVTQGDGIVLAAGTSGEILSSTDGVSWTSRTPGNISGTISALTFGDNTFLAMTSSFVGTFYPGYYSNHFFGATSDNVADWTLRGSLGGTASPLANIAFGAGTFVGVGDNNAFYSQDNGATWSPGTITGVSWLADVAYGNGRFVATDGAGDNVAVSTDGVLWTTGAMGLPSAEYLGKIGFGNGLFLAVTSAGNVHTSADGTTWTQRTQFLDLTATEISIHSIVVGGGGFMIVTSSGLFFTFDSGATWTAVDPAISVYDGTFRNGAFITVGSTGPGSVFRSGDL